MWILQHKDYGLGNFTNLTPTIKELSKSWGKSVDVYFESPFVEEIFNQSPYINPLKTKPSTKPLFSSSLINKDIQDWRFVYECFNTDNSKIPHTHVPERKTVCIMNGCATNGPKRDAKNPGGDVYKEIISMIPVDFDLYFIGNVDDWEANDWINECEISTIAVSEPQLCQHLIRTCDFVISNDTGWYHVAGAYQKKGFIMWKDTLFLKNQSPNKNFFYSKKNQWTNDFKKWLTTKILY